MAASTLASALSGLSGAQLFNLGKHLTSSDEARALGYLEAMQANPGAAMVEFQALSGVQNLPSTVLSFASAAIAALGTPAYSSNLLQAIQALQEAFTSESALQKAGF